MECVIATYMHLPIYCILSQLGMAVMSVIYQPALATVSSNICSQMYIKRIFFGWCVCLLFYTSQSRNKCLTIHVRLYCTTLIQQFIMLIVCCSIQQSIIVFIRAVELYFAILIRSVLNLCVCVVCVFVCVCVCIICTYIIRTSIDCSGGVVRHIMG